MSRKEIEQAVQNVDLTADIGPVLKLMGDVMTRQYYENNPHYLSAEERRAHGKKPVAEVHRSDIQVRVGNQLFTVVPTDENKAMVSIPVGMSDKATPATIPREWLIGMFIDPLITMFDGDPTIAYKYCEGVNSAINRAMQVDADGRMKIDQKLLPEPVNHVEVAEMIASFKRTFKSKSNPSAKLHFTIEAQELEQIVEPTDDPDAVFVSPHPSPADILSQRAEELLALHSTPEEDKVAGEAHGSALASPEPSPASVEAVASPHEANDTEEVVEVSPAHLSQPVDENPHNFKKDPTSWIKHELVNRDKGTFSIEEVAEIADCHVQTIKRALDKFQDEAEYVHFHSAEIPEWVGLDIPLNHPFKSGVFQLSITCERSVTGRYARGRPITFTIVEVLSGHDQKIPEEDAFDMIPIEALQDEPPTLKTVDDTDPAQSLCPDCGQLTFHADAPEEAPDFICGDCHLIRLDDDEIWYEETMVRRQIKSIHDGSVHDATEEVQPDEPEGLNQPNFDFPQHIGVEVRGMEMESPQTGRCVVCASPSTFATETAVGTRHFCTEKCWSHYTGNPEKEEGWYGLKDSHDEEVALEAEVAEEKALRAEVMNQRTEDRYDFDSMMGV